ncbi:helix-turn-helix transcriptional regulator [Aquimarina sp. TRL1]|uniref:AraC family transcriptional regulator n=1 Tax=Aquimarina sp. (strain TRL1) TaxID=2736252 RepID=UPI00158F1AFA|nr:AraC family transcriptional regulator [Aquimarina sp. TRL1]QKX05725.1 helix-turn-helix transcriptional regulator [Aquimarina sp. TRL1]
MKKTHYKPTPLLVPYIDRFYVWEYTNGKTFEMPEVLAGTGLEIIFHLGEPYTIAHNTLQKAHTFCPRKKTRIDANSHVHFLSIRFKSGTFRHFCDIPFKLLNDAYLSTEDIWGKEAVLLQEKIDTSIDITAKIQAIESFLLLQLIKHRQKETIDWDAIIHHLYKNVQSNTLETTSSKAGISFRHFERCFGSRFGISPKKFHRIARFQTTIKKLLLNHTTDYLQTALTYGYYDQSHFIRECKVFTGQTPVEYLQTKKARHHFYYKSI